ncbi:hypothetical protein [Rickettsiella grylli]|uniref:Uncharacterized protein n=2 Tax=Rickettsiella grylli TaxID=59196 RepID=A8PN87_9COXI|nr:hypothetical protein [Rickettsiella grylli]EDP46843.1 hypothetical protein RICGR_0936 [Rickettsiella grylli]
MPRTVPKIKSIYLFEIFWLLLLLTYASIAYLTSLHVSFFNSDWVTFFKFFDDLVFEQGHYKDWILFPAPHFFPDMFVFFPFFFLTRNIYFQFLIVSWIMIILYYSSIKIIYSQFFTKQSTLFSLAATSGLFLLAFKNKSPYMLALVPAIHTSELVAGLFLLGIHFF